MNLFDYVTPVLIIFLYFICCLNKKRHDRIVLTKIRKYEEFIRCNLITIIFGVGTLVSIYSMIAVPVFAGRAWSGPIILCCITIGTLHNRIGKDAENSNPFKSALLILLCISFLFTYGEAFVYINRTYNANQERIVSINQQKEDGKTELVLPIIYGYTKYTCYSDKISDGDLSPYPDYWGNVIIARYYDVDTIYMEQ